MQEEDFLYLIDKFFPNIGARVIIGRGHDCALVQSDKLALSSDLFLENTHFSLNYFKPEDIGYKALAINLSDLAACGAKPIFFLLNLIWPSYLDLNFAQKMFASMSLLAKQYNLTLIGGDLSKGERLGISITIGGECSQNFPGRKKANPGDIVFVIGEIGLSKAGLLILQENLPKKDFPLSIKAHLRPKFYLKEGRFLSSQVKSMLDISDGIAKDIHRLLPVGLGLKLEPVIPINKEIIKLAKLKDFNSLYFVLEGGEDYGLLGVIEKHLFPKILSKIPNCWPIGSVIKGETGIYKEKTKLNLQGFDHFVKRK
ncbi:thiamine-monophosphate kinase [Desulfonauticus submarinus]|uniref:Thiamine-monophosphate kinase n=1 Tax=Desulfonauticus submarinus TaxID=206665 RepID=A0A1H0DBA3_9BACT|nr:thiamine-phosphate kinase [Desulfonauticus submarinus]SDN67443.1 thiamine-monophosphate kinase [Desulfonauticus submarinus]